MPTSNERSPMIEDSNEGPTPMKRNTTSRENERELDMDGSNSRARYTPIIASESKTSG